MHRITLFDFIAVAAATILLAACAGGPFSFGSLSTTTSTSSAVEPATAAAAPAGATATLGKVIAALSATVAPPPTATATATVTPLATMVPTSVTWDEAGALILRGQVTRLTQFRSREVFLRLTDGSNVQTVEPQLDDVLTLSQNCGAPCAGLLMITE